MNTFTYEEFKGNSYRFRKRILVTIFSKIFPYNKGPIKGDKQYKQILPDTQNDVDAEYLKRIFKEIHHPEAAEVKVLKGQNKAQVREYIKNLDKSTENTFDVFIFVFLTYMSKPTENSEFKDERIHLEDGLHPMEVFFSDASKPEVMRMKPKIFLIQSDDLSLIFPKEILKGKEEGKVMKIPQDADRLIIMSDIPQKVANPDEYSEVKNPSFMIKAFGETLKENSKLAPEARLDLLSLTPIINQKVQKDIDTVEEHLKEVLTVPLVTSTLTKFVKI